MTEPLDIQRTLGDHGARITALETLRVAEREHLDARLDRIETMLRTQDIKSAINDGGVKARHGIVAALLIILGASYAAMDVLLKVWRMIKS